MSPVPIFVASGDIQGETGESEIDPPPVPRADLAADWERFDVDTGTIFESNLLFTDITGYKYIEKFENTRLRRTVRELTVGRFPDDQETILMAFFTARISFQPNIASVPVVRRAILNRASAAIKAQFEDDLAEKGLVDIQEVEPTEQDIDGDSGVELTKYEASFPAPTTVVPLVDDEELVIDPGEMAVEGSLAVWAADGDLLIAGGAYPAEDFQTSIHETVTDAVSVTLDIELGLRPDEYRETVLGIIESMIETAD